jgi:PhnB protein
MSVTATPHINFDDQAREALGWYQTVFGGDLMLATYGDIHAVERPDQTDKIAFGVLAAPNGLRIMGYDVQPSKTYDAGSNPFYIALHGTHPDEIQHIWGALADGGTTLIPLGPSPFAPLYGMITDRYGVTWIVDATPAQP